MSDINGTKYEDEINYLTRIIKNMMSTIHALHYEKYDVKMIIFGTIFILVVIELIRTRARAAAADNRAAAELEQAKNRAAAVSDEAAIRIARIKIDSDLKQLMNKAVTYIPISTLNIPHLPLSDKTIYRANECIRVFNSHKNTIEQSGSIDNPISVHFLWRQLLQLIQSDPIAEYDSRRIVYEWFIRHPISNSCLSIDFTFIPSTCTFLHWLNYSGGLELKNNPPHESSNSRSTTNNSSVGTMNTNGLRQALSRAAMCVYTRWKTSNETGEFKSFCCYADGNNFAIARVQINGDNVVVAEKTAVMKLTSASDSSEFRGLEVLAYFLLAPINELSDYLTPPELKPLELKGMTENSSYVSWPLYECLGNGSSGIVYSGHSIICEKYDRVVIKTVTENKFCDQLKNELKILQKLSVLKNSAFPLLKDVLYFMDSPKNIQALKLFPLGVSLKSFVKVVGHNIPRVTELINLLGPVITLALKAAHELKIFHRDLRIPNILIVPQDECMKMIVRKAMAAILQINQLGQLI